ncbi:hypothetical protein [Actinomadura algeriensis]|uniref:Uncharacterized protein n=1 Tax=Actinomadura algeriensis TaxID=1679523 RepID=A0ABR9K2S5_9ACTN|nr:hypothetical protein [Actinomadura algeriensis]MBE1537160.1 hypothetical protein [Actinomadura algeriensis]
MDFHTDFHHMRNSVTEEAIGLPHPEGPHLQIRSAPDPNARTQCSDRCVRDVQTITEKWRFHCLCCLRAWEDLYEAWHFGHAIAWQLSGVPAQPPWADPICPECRSLRVKALPAGLVVHRAVVK